MKNNLTEEQKAKIREELSVDNNGKFNKFLAKLQDTLDPIGWRHPVLPANISYFEDLAKRIKRTTSRYRFNFFIELLNESGNSCFYVNFFDDILEDPIDEIILRHTTLPIYHDGVQTIDVDFNGIVKDLEKQVNDYLKTLEEE